MKSKNWLRPTPVKTALFLVFLSVITTLMIFPMARLFVDVNAAREAQYFGYYAILLTMILLMCTLIFERLNAPTLAVSSAVENQIHIGPCDCNHVWIVSPAMNASPLKHRIHFLRKRHANGIQVVIMRGLEINDGLEDLWHHLPNMQVLDLQRSSVSPDLWNSLESCPELKHVLIDGVSSTMSLREVSITLPEVRFYSQPMQVVIHGKPSKPVL